MYLNCFLYKQIIFKVTNYLNFKAILKVNFIIKEIKVAIVNQNFEYYFNFNNFNFNLKFFLEAFNYIFLVGNFSYLILMVEDFIYYFKVEVILFINFK